MWRNETVMLMFEVFVRVALVALSLTIGGGLLLFAMRVYIDSL